MSRMTATETARRFSDVLDRVAAGEEIEVTRAGTSVAVITPPTGRLLSARRFRELVAMAPAVDEAFASDLRSLREMVGPPEQSRPS